MMPFLKSLCLAIAIVAPGLSSAATEFDLGKSGTFSVEVPASWRVTTRLIKDMGYEFIFSPADGGDSKAHFSVLRAPEPHPLDRKRIDRDFTSFCQQRFLPSAVEKKITLQPYKLRQGYGVFCLFTDASLVDQPVKPDDYKVIVPGMIQLNDSLFIVATLFTNDADGPELAAMRAMTESIRIAPPAQP